VRVPDRVAGRLGRAGGDALVEPLVAERRAEVVDDRRRFGTRLMLACRVLAP
jgi:hypothetical protein